MFLKEKYVQNLQQYYKLTSFSSSSSYPTDL